MKGPKVPFLTSRWGERGPQWASEGREKEGGDGGTTAFQGRVRVPGGGLGGGGGGLRQRGTGHLGLTETQRGRLWTA